MNPTLTTFGESIEVLRKSARIGSTAEVVKIFPETGRRRGLAFDSLEADREWRFFPRRGARLIRSGRAKKCVHFFDLDIPALIKNIAEPLYSDEADIEKIEKAFKTFNGKLRKIRQYLLRSSDSPEDKKRHEIAESLQAFNASISQELPSFKPWPNFTIEKIDEVIRLSSWVDRTKIRTAPEFGRPPKAFSILIFHVVNRFSERAFDKSGDPLLKRGGYKIQRNWQLICAALLWLHIQYGIPEIKAFIESHKKEEVSKALESLKIILKKEYQNFKRAGKGRFTGIGSNDSLFLGRHVSSIENGQLVTRVL